MHSISEELLSDNLDAWENRHADRHWGCYPNECLIRAVMGAFKRHSDRASVRILEIGCGAGANLWFLGAEGFTIAGLDISRSAIQNAKKLLDHHRIDPSRVDLRVGDFRALPWESQSFDMVVDVEGLVHVPVPSISAAMSEVSRVLKPGGIFFSVIFGDRTTGSQTGDFLEPGTTRSPTEGPLAGIGITHFVREEEIPALYSPLKVVNVDSLDRTVDNRNEHIFEWLITAHR